MESLFLSINLSSSREKQIKLSSRNYLWHLLDRIQHQPLEKAVAKILQTSQENNYNFGHCRPAILIKRTLQCRCSPVHFKKILKNILLADIWELLLLRKATRKSFPKSVEKNLHSIEA